MKNLARVQAAAEKLWRCVESEIEDLRRIAQQELQVNPRPRTQRDTFDISFKLHDEAYEQSHFDDMAKLKTLFKKCGCNNTIKEVMEQIQRITGKEVKNLFDSNGQALAPTGLAGPNGPTFYILFSANN